MMVIVVVVAVIGLSAIGGGGCRDLRRLALQPLHAGQRRHAGVRPGRVHGLAGGG